MGIRLEQIKDNPEGFAQYHLYISMVKYHSGPISRHYLLLKEEKEMKISSIYLPFFTHRLLTLRATASEPHVTRKFHIRF